MGKKERVRAPRPFNPRLRAISEMETHLVFPISSSGIFKIYFQLYGEVKVGKTFLWVPRRNDGREGRLEWQPREATTSGLKHTLRWLWLLYTQFSHAREGRKKPRL